MEGLLSQLQRKCSILRRPTLWQSVLHLVITFLRYPSQLRLKSSVHTVLKLSNGSVMLHVSSCALRSLPRIFFVRLHPTNRNIVTNDLRAAGQLEMINLSQHVPPSSRSRTPRA